MAGPDFADFLKPLSLGILEFLGSFFSLSLGILKFLGSFGFRLSCIALRNSRIPRLV